ncbi:MAG: hypothetical protein ACLQU4_09280 [Limisphaerales bacterium]
MHPGVFSICGNRKGARNVVAFPKLPEFQQVTLKVLRWIEQDKRLVIKEAEMVE